jgi:signal transduction histidine kinase
MARGARRLYAPDMDIARMNPLPPRWRGAAGIALVVALTVAGAYTEANPAHSYAGLRLTGHPPLPAYALTAIPGIALAWRRRAPVTVFAVTAAAAVCWAALGQIDGALLVPVIVAMYQMALTRPRHVALAAGLAGAAAIFAAEGTLGPFGWLGGPNATMWPELLAAGALGGYTGARRQWLAAERDRAERERQAREEETRRRVDAERIRIARELHDVVAHSMAMINVQASAAAMLLAEDPAGAAGAIQAIRGASKSGLRELRAILRVLRDSGAPEADAPGLGDIRALADAASAAGTPASARISVPAAPPAPEVTLAAYRIAQESLTNAVRHASGAAVTVTVRPDGTDLLAEIVNERPPGAASPGDGACRDGAGAGLAGMRERAAALGGTLTAGPLPGGGFAVRARLPLVPETHGRPQQAAAQEGTCSPATGRQALPDAGPLAEPATDQRA